VHDHAGQSVAVTERGVVTGEPTHYRVCPRVPWQPVAAWAGPWPVDDSWWMAGEERGRSARFQVVGADGRAWLLRWRESGWEAEAGYD
jgi:protein ImuB